jgi:hypothetical protein
LWGDPLLEEFMSVRQQIIMTHGRRGAISRAIAVLAERHRIEFDAMRKRLDLLRKHYGEL